jgi:hypothetical protein
MANELVISAVLNMTKSAYQNSISPGWLSRRHGFTPIVNCRSTGREIGGNLYPSILTFPLL